MQAQILGTQTRTHKHARPRGCLSSAPLSFILILPSLCHSCVAAQLIGMCVRVFGRLLGNVYAAALKDETS